MSKRKCHRRQRSWRADGLSHEFDAGPGAKPEVNFCPEDLREEVDRTLDELYEPVNNRAGFVTTQDA